MPKKALMHSWKKDRLPGKISNRKELIGSPGTHLKRKH
jgi:hypothetical protein